ncbi:hypothetical protein [Paenibacillus sp. SI8]|uniref:hypothetical protein n=1 Tax=unclassified Paenibacillus TaxID=185978 RepID=UPI00346624D8
MSEIRLAQPEVFQLDNASELLLYRDFLIGHLKQAQSQVIMEDLASGTIPVDRLEQHLHEKMLAVRVSCLEGLYTDVKGDETVTIAYKSFETGERKRKKLTFKSLDEKNKFIAQLYRSINQDFTYVNEKNTRLGSIRKPLSNLLKTLVIGGGLSWLAYYMETSESYSFRVPALLYFLVVIMEYVGYVPIVAITGVILICMLIWLVKNTINPTEKLVIERYTKFNETGKVRTEGVQ